MATIKEMAEKKYPIKITAGLGYSYDMNELSRNGYIAGANTVLDLLQERLSDRHFTSAAFLQMDIEDFIKELKGE